MSNLKPTPQSASTASAPLSDPPLQSAAPILYVTPLAVVHPTLLLEPPSPSSTPEFSGSEPIATWHLIPYHPPPSFTRAESQHILAVAVGHKRSRSESPKLVSPPPSAHTMVKAQGSFTPHSTAPKPFRHKVTARKLAEPPKKPVNPLPSDTETDTSSADSTPLSATPQGSKKRRISTTPLTRPEPPSTKSSTLPKRQSQ